MNLPNFIERLGRRNVNANRMTPQCRKVRRTLVPAWRAFERDGDAAPAGWRLAWYRLVNLLDGWRTDAWRLRQITRACDGRDSVKGDTICFLRVLHSRADLPRVLDVSAADELAFWESLSQANPQDADLHLLTAESQFQAGNDAAGQQHLVLAFALRPSVAVDFDDRAQQAMLNSAERWNYQRWRIAAHRDAESTHFPRMVDELCLEYRDDPARLSTIRHEASLHTADVLARLEQQFPPERRNGCTPEEIARLESLCGKRLPAAYRWFLTNLGTKDHLWLGCDFFYDDLVRFYAHDADEDDAEQDVPDLPDDGFVFGHHQGYLFWWFRTRADGDDPPVYFYNEGAEKSELADKCYSHWLTKAVWRSMP